MNNPQNQIFFKKSAISIFALVALFVYSINLLAMSADIIQGIIDETNIFKSEGRPTINLYPHAKQILITIFIFLGIRLYLQAWAIEDTLLINRIKKPIRNKRLRNILSFFDILLRLLWTLLIMVFPFYISLEVKPIHDLPWHWYFVIIYIFIFFWDLTVIKPYLDYYKNDSKKKKSALIYWFGADLAFLFLVNISAFCIQPNFWDLKGWNLVIFLLTWLGILILSIFQIFVFGKFIFSNKISYSYD